LHHLHLCVVAGSLFPHNVVLVPLGDDFRYSNQLEFDQQYENYMKLMTYINSRPTTYHAHVSFGTLADYFSEVRARMTDFSTLTGDFHVYSDIFSEGRPAYWSGYYFTRPAAKLLGRQVAARLREVELLYAVALAGSARRRRSGVARTVLAAQFAQLETARRNLGLFQHHDAITGTSKAFVMRDYEEKLMQAQDSLNGLEVLLIGYHLLFLQQQHGGTGKDQEEDELAVIEVGRRRLLHLNPFNKPELHRDDYVGGERVLTFNATTPDHVIVVYNALPHTAERTAFFRSSAADVCVYDTRGARVASTQVLPAYNVTAGRPPRLETMSSLFDVWFTVILEPVSLAAFAVRTCDMVGDSQTPPTQIYCQKCYASVGGDVDGTGAAFDLRPLPPGSLQLENQLYRLVFDEETRLLRSVTNKISGTVLPVEISFAAYKSEVFRYLYSVTTIFFSLKQLLLISFEKFNEVQTPTREGYYFC
jgi:alpha-mannosidase